MPRASIAERLYRASLRCYPGEFRDEYEREMVDAFRDRLGEDRKAGVRAVVRLWGQVVADALLLAPGEHLDVLGQDVRYAMRTLRRAPLFAFTAVATLALGVGANAAVFSVVHAVALRPLQYGEADRLIRIWEDNQALAISTFAVSIPNFESWRERASTVDLAAWQQGSATIRGTGDPVRVVSLMATPELFSLLGTRARTGRMFAAEDAAPDAPAVAMITEGLWFRQFGGDRSVIGRPVPVGDAVATIVGILPDEAVPVGAELVRPLKTNLSKEDRSDHLSQVVGRLRPGVSVEQARSELQSIARRLESEYPASNRGWSVTVSTLYDWVVPEETRRALYIVLGAACCVLLIACANVANLMLARTAARSREIAVRLAIGAGRRRLVRQVVTEGLLLMLFGAGAGVLAAFWTMPFLRGWLPADLPRATEAAVNGPVLIFALVLCATTGAMFAALPAIAASRSGIIEALKQTTRRQMRTHRTGQALAGAQVALATSLLITAGLLAQSFLRLRSVPLGFDPSNVASATMGLPEQRYSSPGAGWAFYQQLIERLEAAPGVESAAVTSGAPFDGGNTGQPIEAVGPSRLDGKSLQADWRMVSASYFRTLRIPVVRGQLFAGNRRGDDRTIVLSEAMARRIWGDGDPIGREIAVNPIGDFRVVGVVGDVRNLQLAREPNPTMYISAAAYLWPAMTVIVRSRTGGAQLASLIHSVVRDLDPQLAIFNVTTTAQQITDSAAQPRLNASLVVLFAAIACVLSAVGIYGVLAYLVSQHRQEIGIRMALGAARRAVLRLVLAQGLRLTIPGVLVGIGVAAAAARWIESIVFGVSPRDSWTFAGAAALVVGVALLASYVPARRATNVDPLIALRAD